MQGPVTKKIVELFLEEIGTKKIKHIKNKSLFDHLMRTATILESWGVESYVVYAGMCHSVYSTEIFQKEVLSRNNRKKLQDIIGKKAEELVYFFSILNRNSLQQETDSLFSFTDRYTHETIKLSKNDCKDLATILLANQIDHLNVFSVMQSGSTFLYLEPWISALEGVPHVSMKSFLDGRSSQKDEDEYVRFIAHTGVHIKTRNIAVAIDPWLFSSSHEHALIQGFDPSSTTVDFIVPEPRNTPRDIVSDIIILSHFHTHHAPYYEIAALIGAKESIDIVCPVLEDHKLAKLKTWLKDDFDKITFHFIEKDTVLIVRGVTITCLTHNNPEHFAYLVDVGGFSVMHIVDAASRVRETKGEFADYWNKYDNLKPDFLFIGAAGHSIRLLDSSGKKYIVESSTLSPVQAAKITQRIGAKNVAAAGMFNFSIWDARVEFAFPYEFIESQFYWAMSFLEPSIAVHQLRPGDTFRKNNDGNWYKSR